MFTVSVRLFAHFRERAGIEVVSVDLPDGSPVSTLRERLAQTWPDLAGLLARSAIAVNEEYVSDDRVIRPEDDLALIPPVSGGLDWTGMLQLTREPIDHAALTEAVRRPDCGAVVTFLGTVRDLTGDEVTVALEYEAYPPMAERKMAEIEADVRAHWAVGEVALVHRLGRLEVGEVSVAVAVSAPHRAEAFAACRHAIDRLKELVPIWKKDVRPLGAAEWVHPTATGEAP